MTVVRALGMALTGPMHMGFKCNAVRCKFFGIHVQTGSFAVCARDCRGIMAYMAGAVSSPHAAISGAGGEPMKAYQGQYPRGRETLADDALCRHIRRDGHRLARAGARGAGRRPRDAEAIARVAHLRWRSSMRGRMRTALCGAAHLAGNGGAKGLCVCGAVARCGPGGARATVGAGALRAFGIKVKRTAAVERAGDFRKR